MKRGSEKQGRKEDVSDDEEAVADSGTFARASEEELRQRVIVRVKRREPSGQGALGSGSSILAAPGEPIRGSSPFANFTGLTGGAAPVSAASPFSGFTGLTGAPPTSTAPKPILTFGTKPGSPKPTSSLSWAPSALSKPDDGSKVATFGGFGAGGFGAGGAPMFGKPAPAAAFGSRQGASGAPAFSFNAAPGTEGASEMRELNATFKDWIATQYKQNPDIPWTAGVLDYIDYVTTLDDGEGDEEEKKDEKQSNGTLVSSTAAPGFAFPASTSIFGTNGLSSAAAPAPANGFGAGFTFGGGLSGLPSSSTNKTAPGFSFNMPPGGFATPAASAGAAVIADDDDELPKEAPADIGRAVGEADEEDVVHEVRAKLYYMQDNEYKDLGVGVLRGMRHKTTDKRRLVLRNDTGKVLLNVCVYAGMKFQQNKNKNSVSFSAPLPEGGGVTPHSLRVKAEHFDELVTKLQELVP